VEPRVKNSKITKPNSSNQFLFAKQRESLRFPQKQEPHLATLFPVRLREHPFSEIPQKFQTFTQTFPIAIQKPKIQPIS
jgi:hypothetical protein